MSSESATTLSLRAAVLFLALLERHDQLVLSRNLLRYRELVKEMVDYGLLAFETHASEIMVDVTGGQESVELEIDKAAGVARFSCPESGRDLSIPLREVELYRLVPHRLCEEIAAQLAIPSRYQTWLAAPLLTDRLWCLGEAKIGAFHMPVFVARSLRNNLDAVIRSLEERPDLKKGVILYTGRPPDARIGIPSGHVPVSLDNIWITGEERLIINRVLIDRLVTHKLGDAIDSTFSFDESGTLTIGDRSRRFKGKQKAIITWFWQHRSSDAAGFSWVDVKADVQSRSDSLANAMGERIDSDFRLDDWFELVSRGHHRLLRR